MKVFDGHFPETKKACAWKSALWTGKIILHILSQPHTRFCEIVSYTLLTSFDFVHSFYQLTEGVSFQTAARHSNMDIHWLAIINSFVLMLLILSATQTRRCCWPMVFPPTTWRIIPVTQWLIVMVSKSPEFGCSTSKWPKWLINGAY